MREEELLLDDEIVVELLLEDELLCDMIPSSRLQREAIPPYSGKSLLME